MTWKVVLPIKVPIDSKKFYLNLNQYRNAHYHTLNRAKVTFADMVKPLLKDIPFLDNCNFKYVYYAPSKQQVDIANVCSVIDKFFSDTFVAAGKLIDDNYNYLKKVTYVFGGIDSKNPRVEVFISTKETQRMKLIITQADLQQAVSQHLANSGFNIAPELIQIELDDIEINLGSPAPVDKPATTKRTRQTKATTADKEVPADVEEPKATGSEDTQYTDSLDEEDKDAILDVLDQTPPQTQVDVTSSIFD